VFTVLCASDPYAVLGVTNAYRLRPDVVTGIAASTDAATSLVGKLSGLPAFNVMDKTGAEQFEMLMMQTIGPVVQSARQNVWKSVNAGRSLSYEAAGAQ
jgi:hypothetical protein